MAFNLANYEEVKDRIPRFWQAHPGGSIRTTRLDSAPGEWVVHAALYREGEAEPFATGLAHETQTDRGVNATSALENCETSAIGRALANGGFSAGANRPSREEMTKPARNDGPPKPSQPHGQSRTPDPVSRALAAVLEAFPGLPEDAAKRAANKHWAAAKDAASKPADIPSALVALIKADGSPYPPGTEPL